MTGVVLALALAATQPRTPREWIGEPGLALVAAARRVEAFRLEGLTPSDTPSGLTSIRDLTVQTRRVVEDPAFLSRLSRILRDDGAWGPSSQGYEIAYLSDVGFRFEDGGRTLEVLLCLRCGLATVPWADNAWVFEIKSQRELLDLALEVFPEDRPLLWLRAQRVAPKTPADLLGPAAAILTGPFQAEALAVKPVPGAPREIAELQVTGTHLMDAALAARLARALSDPRTYEFEVYKPCAFVPNVAFRIRKGPETAEAILCFGCMELVLNTQDAGGRPVHRSGSVFHGGDLWAIAAAALGEAELRRILKQARP